MEVKIGVQNVNRELTLDVTQSADEIQAAVAQAIAENGVLSLADAKGRRVVVPVAKLAYVDVSSSVSGQVGFRS